METNAAEIGRGMTERLAQATIFERIVGMVGPDVLPI